MLTNEKPVRTIIAMDAQDAQIAQILMELENTAESDKNIDYKFLCSFLLLGLDNVISESDKKAMGITYNLTLFWETIEAIAKLRGDAENLYLELPEREDDYSCCKEQTIFLTSPN